MINIYEYSLGGTNRTLECDGLLFVEYQCQPGKKLVPAWSQHSHLSFIVSGTKTWITPDGNFVASAGDAVFCKKGAYLIENNFNDNFCALIFFIPEDFIKEVVQELDSFSFSNSKLNSPAVRVQVDISLQAFFNSVMSYFDTKLVPSQLLKLKFKELILQILFDDNNKELANYFLSLSTTCEKELKQIMYDNFLFNLSLQEFAKICNRSLSSFKRDFNTAFGMPPKKWMREERLKHAKMRLLTTDESINDIAFHSGFETTSHFIYSFKQLYHHPPSYFRKKNRETLQKV